MVIVLAHLGAALKWEDEGLGKIVQVLPTPTDESGMPKYELIELTPNAVRGLGSGRINPRRYGLVQEYKS